MQLGSLELQIFVALTLVLGSAFVALVCDFLKGNNEQLRERNIELRVRQDERERLGLFEPLAHPIVWLQGLAALIRNPASVADAQGATQAAAGTTAPQPATAARGAERTDLSDLTGAASASGESSADRNPQRRHRYDEFKATAQNQSWATKEELEQLAGRASRIRARHEASQRRHEESVTARLATPDKAIEAVPATLEHREGMRLKLAETPKLEQPKPAATPVEALAPVAAVAAIVKALPELAPAVELSSPASLAAELPVNVETAVAVETPIVIDLPVVEEPPVVVVEPPVVVQEPVVVVEPPVVVQEPVVAVEPPVVVQEPVVAFEPPVVVQAPVVAFEPPVAVQEPVVAFEPPVVVQAPVVAVEPPVVVQAPVVAVEPPVVVEAPAPVVAETPATTPWLFHLVTEAPKPVEFVDKAELPPAVLEAEAPVLTAEAVPAVVEAPTSIPVAEAAPMTSEEDSGINIWLYPPAPEIAKAVEEPIRTRIQPVQVPARDEAITEDLTPYVQQPAAIALPATELVASPVVEARQVDTAEPALDVAALQKATGENRLMPPATMLGEPQGEGKLEIPAGLHESATLSRLIENQTPYSGVVVAIGLNDYDTLRDKLASGTDSVAALNKMVLSMLRPQDFACRFQDDEYILIYPGERGSSAQRRLFQVSEKLWDFQLRSLGNLSVMFSWGGLEVTNETLSEAVASARERMYQTKRNRKPSGLEFSVTRKKVVNG